MFLIKIQFIFLYLLFYQFSSLKFAGIHPSACFFGTNYQEWIKLFAYGLSEQTFQEKYQMWHYRMITSKTYLWPQFNVVWQDNNSSLISLIHFNAFILLHLLCYIFFHVNTGFLEAHSEKYNTQAKFSYQCGIHMCKAMDPNSSKTTFHLHRNKNKLKNSNK